MPHAMGCDAILTFAGRARARPGSVGVTPRGVVKRSPLQAELMCTDQVPLDADIARALIREQFADDQQVEPAAPSSSSVRRTSATPYVQSRLGEVKEG
ncbi:hypothetical protein [Microbacterium aurantiacum]|uniref:Uncharacterized protein n=1 Tax=Microbacterium aurantiacum TaxID=162393 RepID=A0AAJ2LXY0_9MICO|nr:hypothetical protein [Microbacterium aurantiacum]MDS0244858.1 hypothetical protein [Microbacterium aurantiacum]